jgi:small-conductance mechanosensitive channel
MSTAFERIRQMLTDAGQQASTKIIDILPQAAVAVLIVGIGLLVSAALYFLAMRIMEFFAIDKLAGKTPLQRFLRDAGIHKNVSHILGLLVFWLGVLVTLILAADALQLEQVSSALAVVTRFIPQLIAALLIVIFGMLLAKFLQVFVEQTLVKAHLQFAAVVGKVVYVCVLLFVLHLVIEQLGFQLSFITTNMMLAISAIVVVCGIGFVLSCKTLLENAAACYQLRQHLKVGDRVAVSGAQGAVAAFTLTSVVLQTSAGKTILPALAFYTSSYTIENQHEQRA